MSPVCSGQDWILADIPAKSLWVDTISARRALWGADFLAKYLTTFTRIPWSA